MRTDAWRMWGRRLRTHLRDQGSSLREVAEKMGLAESTLRSWTNDTRKINLSDFFALCAAAGADPATMLFGHPVISQEQRKALGQLAVSILEADPLANADYPALLTAIKKAQKGRPAPK